METFTFRRGPAGATVQVAVGDETLTVTRGRRASVVNYAELTAVRWLHTASPQRLDFGLVLKTPGTKTVINSNSRASMADQDTLADAAAAALFAIHRKRPDLELTVAPSPAFAWGIFACFAVPTVLGLLFGLMLISEPGGLLYGIFGLLVGGLSLISAWSARPWRKPARHSLTAFANRLAAPAEPG